MKKGLALLYFSLLLFSCQRDDIPPPPDAKFDTTKFVNKEWYLGGKQTPQLLSIHFRSNDSAVMTKCVWIVPPYQYQTQKWFWQPIGKDSINLGGYRFRVYSVTDSVLVTSNWVVGGPGISDTIRQTFRTY
ncbi:MAG: hypothetical protein M3Q06_14210 [Bacteroidota bacterium]|nr:hypothetical protein [Bacteroidota bacterium]